MCKFITNVLEKDREVGGGAAGWIGHWSLLSPDFLNSPFQGGNPVLKANASLFLTDSIPPLTIVLPFPNVCD